MDLTLAEFLMWLISGGGAVLAASWVLERMAWFQKIESSDAKEWIFFGCASVIGVGAYCLVTYAPVFLAAAQPFFMILAGIFGSVFLGKKFHVEDKK
jgi:hypothetical protein